MRPETAIEVKNITKTFKVYKDKGHTLKEKALFSKRRTFEVRKVIDGISFDVKKGEAVGIIGHNGCGKSTTLKMLTRIMYPDSGSIEMEGRVSSLIELGAGFHPDMSGRDNIYINASIFGLTKQEIDERIDDIISFSELEEYMDNPVRTYSSGMYMRLAFSVAINVDADILLIDEILAVGDANFQMKCFNKLREIKGKGVTIVIVSHSLNQIEQICDRSIWIDKGKIRKQGIPTDVHPEYLEYMMGKGKTKKIISDSCNQNTEEEKTEQQNGRREYGERQVEVIDVFFDKKDGKQISFDFGADIELNIKYKKNDTAIKNIVVGFNIIRNDGVYCYGTNTQIDMLPQIDLNSEGNIKINLTNVRLLRGIYNMDIALSDFSTGLAYHYIYKAIQFEIRSSHDELGIFSMHHEWNIN